MSGSYISLKSLLIYLYKCFFLNVECSFCLLFYIIQTIVFITKIQNKFNFILLTFLVEKTVVIYNTNIENKNKIEKQCYHYICSY